jgi:hypothetical protein
MLRLLVISKALHLAVDVGVRSFWTPFLGRQTSYQGSFALVNNHYGFTRPMTRGVDRNLYPFTAGVPRRSLTDAERLADQKRRTGPVLVTASCSRRVANGSGPSLVIVATSRQTNPIRTAVRLNERRVVARIANARRRLSNRAGTTPVTL